MSAIIVIHVEDRVNDPLSKLHGVTHLDRPDGRSLVSLRTDVPGLRVTRETVTYGDRVYRRYFQAEGFTMQPHGANAVLVTGHGVARFKLFMPGKRQMLPGGGVRWRMSESGTVTLEPVSDGAALQLSVLVPGQSAAPAPIFTRLVDVRSALQAWTLFFNDMRQPSEWRAKEQNHE